MGRRAVTPERPARDAPPCLIVGPELVGQRVKKH